MLISVEVSNGLDEALTLPLEDISDGYLVKDIDGLDPVKATIVSTNFAMRNGVQYQASHTEERNLVITLGLEPDYAIGTVRDLRTRLYNFFMPATLVTLRFNHTDMPPVEIVGRVESFGAPPFAQEPEAVISILCFKSPFYELEPTVINGTTNTDPFSAAHRYVGTVETGLSLSMTLGRVSSGFTIFQAHPSGVERVFEFALPLLDGDLLNIDTSPGSKSAYLIRDGILLSALRGVSPTSDWPTLLPGDNYMRIYEPGLPPIAYTISYTNKYGGL